MYTSHIPPSASNHPEKLNNPKTTIDPNSKIDESKDIILNVRDMY